MLVSARLRFNYFRHEFLYLNCLFLAGLTIDHFYGDKKAETTQNGEGGSDDDLVLAVKRRRMAVEERKIKEVQEQQLLVF